MAKINYSQIKNTNILIILQTAEKLGIQAEILDYEKYKIRLTYQGKSHIIWKKSLGINPKKGIKTSRDKNLTFKVLQKGGLPVLPQIVIKSIKDYKKNYAQIPFPQVIKPLYGEKGKDIYLNILNLNEGVEALKNYLQKAQSFSKLTNPACVVEPYFQNAKDYRFMVLNNKVIGFSQRMPPIITADGRHNLKELIKQENKRRLQLNRTLGKRMLNRILIWQRIKWYLHQQNLTLESIPYKNKKITLYPIPNFSTGGLVKTIALEQIHPSFINLALKTAKTAQLKIIGIDILIRNLKKKADKNNCAIIEINSDPGLRLHEWPNLGKPQKVTEKILKYIFLEKTG